MFSSTLIRMHYTPKIASDLLCPETHLVLLLLLPLLALLLGPLLGFFLLLLVRLAQLCSTVALEILVLLLELKVKEIPQHFEELFLLPFPLHFSLFHALTD